MKHTIGAERRSKWKSNGREQLTGGYHLAHELQISGFSSFRFKRALDIICLEVVAMQDIFCSLEFGTFVCDRTKSNTV